MQKNKKQNKTLKLLWNQVNLNIKDKKPDTKEYEL